jgi:hypothetical protein
MVNPAYGTYVVQQGQIDPNGYPLQAYLVDPWYEQQQQGVQYDAQPVYCDVPVNHEVDKEATLTELPTDQGNG